jgi:hypothetical protein
MGDVVRDIFALHQVDKFDDINLVESYKYFHFSNKFINGTSEEVDALVDKIIGVLKAKQDQIKQMRQTPIEVIKEDVSPKTYKWIEKWGITNLYDLRMNIHRRYNGVVHSKIVGIGQKNGTEVVDAMEKHGIGRDSLYTERWE